MPYGAISCGLPLPLIFISQYLHRQPYSATQLPSVEPEYNSSLLVSVLSQFFLFHTFTLLYMRLTLFLHGGLIFSFHVL
jgi:hypothetical protein